MSAPVVTIAPVSEPGIEEAVIANGGELGDAANADAVIWTNPRDPDGLRELLQSSPASWVQLPFAGIESFFAAGVIDPNRTWTCAKGIYGPACAEHALALMFAGSRRLAHHARAKTWEEPGFGSPERRLEGATVVLVGTGGIGLSLARMLVPFGVRIVGVNRSGAPLEGADRTVTTAQLDDVLPEGDYVVIAAALTDATRGLFDRGRLRRMGRDAWLVNVARGGLVVTSDLVDALKEGVIAGAGLDVTDPEPLPDDHELWGLDNVLITPHVANTWDMALPDLRALVGRNVANFVQRRGLEGLVDPSLGY